MKGRRLPRSCRQGGLFDEESTPPADASKPCVAYVADQLRCGRPGVVYAPSRGGWCCGDHAPGMPVKKGRLG